ncbi:MAG: Rhs element Vgr protein [Burkholderiales bacterium]|nr:Rhs element Vgr protein [Burkholderiales bacterium]
MSLELQGLQGGISHGVTLGTVSNTKDEKGLGRVKVIFSLTGQQIESDWIQIMSFFAGAESGAFFLPQTGDSALLAFADGNPSKPYVLGFLWNGVQKPPVDAARQQEVRVIKTKLGKTILLDDSSAGKITIVDNKKNQIEIDTANNKISISSQGDLAIAAKGKISISGAQVLVQNTAGSVKADLSASGMQLNGAQNLKLSAAMIDLN